MCTLQYQHETEHRINSRGDRSLGGSCATVRREMAVGWKTTEGSLMEELGGTTSGPLNCTVTSEREAVSVSLATGEPPLAW